jgi:outer membrane protein
MVALAWSLVLMLVIAGCTSWRGDMDPRLERLVQERLERPEWTTLEEQSKSRPTTIEQDLPKLRARVPIEASPSDQSGKPKPDASRRLSIAESRASALNNNLDLRVALVDPEIASTNVSEEEARFDQLIYARAKFSRKNLPANDSDLVQLKTLEPNVLSDRIVKLQEPPQRKDVLDVDLGLSIPLRTGGRLTLSTPFAELRTDGAGFKTQQFRNALRFSFSQPLLRDAGIDTNVASIRMAKYEQRATDVRTRLAAIRIVAKLDQVYWGLNAAWSELEVRRQQYQIALDNLKLVQRRVQEGLSAPIEVNRAEIGVAERVEQLVVAETNIKLRQRQLKFFMNDPDLAIDTTTTIVPTTPPTLVSFEFDPEELAKRALQSRLELLDLELKLAADQVKIDYLRNQTLPMFMLDYEYSSIGRANQFNDAFDNSLALDTGEWGLGLRMEIPVSNEQRESRLRRAISERLQKLTTKELRELTVRREILDAVDQLGLNWNRILAARQNVLIAGKNYDAELKQFKEGMRTMTEVLETLTRLGEAQVREIRAIGDYQVAQIDLAFATGTLLGYGRVALDRSM